MSVQPDIFQTDILPLFEWRHPDWLSQARSVARALCLKNGTATIDDVRELCPPPHGSDPRCMGAVFSTKDFEAAGFRKSARQTCHHRPITVFRLVEG